jgi:hypothetical protein
MPLLPLQQLLLLLLLLLEGSHKQISNSRYAVVRHQ